MNISKTVLEENQIYNFDSFSIRLSFDIKSKEKYLELNINGKILKMEGVIDIGELVDKPISFIIEDTQKSKSIFLGGTKIAIVDFIDLSMTYWELRNRDIKDLEYWTNNLLINDENVYFIYEGGIVFIDKFLSIQKEMKKFYDEDVNLSNLLIN